MPDFPIVDTHVHLIEPDLVPLAWGNDAPTLNRRHSVAELDRARSDIELEGFVFVEADVEKGRHLDEAAVVANVAASEPRLKAIVASAPLEIGAEVEADLASLRSYRLLRGIRRLLQHEADPEFCLRPGFIEGVRLLPKFDLHFEICIFHHQFAAAIELVRRCPEVTFILDHIGKPAIRDGMREPWSTQIAELAALPNVTCKLSGLVTEADHAGWQPADLQFYVDTVVGNFGFERIMFGSDWPVVTLASSYRRWVEVLDRALAGCTKEELRKLYRDNAMTFYRFAE